MRLVTHDNDVLAAARRPRARRPLSERKRMQRGAARLLIARRTRRPPTAAQLAFDPLTRPSQGAARRRARLGLSTIGSLAFHGAAVALGLALATGATGPRRQEVKIEMRQRPAEPPPERKPEPPEPVEKPKRPPVKVAKAPPPAAVPPRAAPVRVVGLSLESTSDSGDGPAFAVGNTRLGETEKTAAQPHAAPPPLAAPALVSPAPANQVASRLPVAGVKYERPKPLRTPEPTYPAELKSQGIEADVMVLASIDADGKVTAVRIIREASYAAFNEAARASVLTYQYEPATRDGIPTTYQLSFTVRFRVKADE